MHGAIAIAITVASSSLFACQQQSAPQSQGSGPQVPAAEDSATLSFRLDGMKRINGAL